MVIEGMLALTGQHFIIDFNEREGTLPGFVRGFNFVARDEHRHVAFGSRFLRDMVAEQPQYMKNIQRTLEESLAIADQVLRPPWVEDVESYEYFGVSLDETRDSPPRRSRGAQGDRPRAGHRLTRPGSSPSPGAEFGWPAGPPRLQ